MEHQDHASSNPLHSPPRRGKNNMKTLGVGHKQSISADSTTRGSFANQPYSTPTRRSSIIEGVQKKLESEHREVFCLVLVIMLLLHWVDMGSDLYMIGFYWVEDYETFYVVALLFFVLSTMLSLFWNFQLYNREKRRLCFAIFATILGPVSRKVLDKLVSKRTYEDDVNEMHEKRISSAIGKLEAAEKNVGHRTWCSCCALIPCEPEKEEDPESDDEDNDVQGWRDDHNLYTEEFKNFTLIYAAIFEDLPQAAVNLAFLSRGDGNIPKLAIIQVVASMVMGVGKVYLGCGNILCNYAYYEKHISDRRTASANPSVDSDV